MPEVVVEHRTVDPRVYESKIFEERFPNAEAYARGKEAFRIHSDLASATFAGDAERVKIQETFTKELGEYTKKYGSLGERDVVLEHRDIFPTSAEDTRRVAEYIDNPERAPENQRKAYQTIKEMHTTTVDVAKSVVESVQARAGDDVNSTREIKEGSKTYDYLEKRLTKWDLAMFVARFAALAAVLVGGYFLIKNYLDKLTGCYRTDNDDSGKHPQNLNDICSVKVSRDNCSCDYASYSGDTTSGSLSLVRQCENNSSTTSSTRAPFCYKSKEDYDTAVRTGVTTHRLHSYEWQQPTPFQAMADLADTIGQGLSSLLESIGKPLVTILIYVAIGVAVIGVIVLAWKLIDYFNKKREDDKLAIPPPPS